MTVKERLINCLDNIGLFIEEDDSLKDVVNSSLLFISMIIEIEQEFNVEIPDDYLDMEKLSTLSDLERMVNELTIQ